MSVVRNSLVLILSACCFFFANSAGAQVPGNRDKERIRILETRVNQLEGVIANINQRVSNLEYNRRPDPYPQPPEQQEVICTMIDRIYSKVFIGRGRVRLEAEADVRTSCSASIHASYCQEAVKCSDPMKDPFVRGAICTLTDTAYSKTFKGEAKSVLEAEYNTRKTCGNQVHPSYCTGPIRCETY